MVAGKHYRVQIMNARDCLSCSISAFSSTAWLLSSLTRMSKQLLKYSLINWSQRSPNSHSQASDPPCTVPHSRTSPAQWWHRCGLLFLPPHFFTFFYPLFLSSPQISKLSQSVRTRSMTSFTSCSKVDFRAWPSVRPSLGFLYISFPGHFTAVWLGLSFCFFFFLPSSDTVP